MTVFLLEEVELFETAVEIGSSIVPRVAGVVLVCVAPRVGEIASWHDVSHIITW